MSARVRESMVLCQKLTLVDVMYPDLVTAPLTGTTTLAGALALGVLPVEVAMPARVVVTKFAVATQ